MSWCWSLIVVASVALVVGASVGSLVTAVVIAAGQAQREVRDQAAPLDASHQG